MKKTTSLLLCLIVSAFPLHAVRVRALVKVPVADACVMRIGDCTKDVQSFYRKLPYSPSKGTYACPRVHQLLFNELVTIIQEFKSGEVIVRSSGFFFLNRFNKRRTTFWMLKKDLMPLSEIPQKFYSYIPTPINYKRPVKDYSHKLLTLSKPWYDKKTKKTYSVGTRFVHIQENDTATAYGISFINPETMRVHYARIPKQKALATYHRSFTKRRRVFMSLLRSWVRPRKGFIPYVYGGSSFTVPLEQNRFALKKSTKCGQEASFWLRKGGVIPLSGIDCSNMIMRAAQMAGLPYYFKNTRTLINTLRPLKRGEIIEEGDLVWYQGHVMIVSDVKKNLLIESIGYDSGYGRVHELPVHKAFRGIKNFGQLKRVHYTHNFTMRLGCNGRPWRSVHRLTIYKLRSCLNRTY